MNTKRELARRMGEAERMIDLLTQAITEQGQVILELTSKAIDDLEKPKRNVVRSRKMGIPNSHTQILKVWLDEPTLTLTVPEILELGGLPETQAPRVSDLKKYGCLKTVSKVGKRECITITDKGLMVLAKTGLTS